MSFFASLRAKRELDGIIHEINVNLANNYKDVAHDYRRRLGERCEALYREGALKDKEYHAYRAKYETYTQVMKDYHH